MPRCVRAPPSRGNARRNDFLSRTVRAAPERESGLSPLSAENAILTSRGQILPVRAHQRAFPLGPITPGNGVINLPTFRGVPLARPDARFARATLPRRSGNEILQEHYFARRIYILITGTEILRSLIGHV